MVSTDIFQDRHFSTGKVASLVQMLMIDSNPTSVELQVAFNKDSCDWSVAVWEQLPPPCQAYFSSPLLPCGFDLKQKAHLTAGKGWINLCEIYVRFAV